MAIVTGGTRGMGAAEVYGLVREGAKVVFGGRSIEQGRAVEADLDGRAVFMPFDVTSESDWEQIVALAVDRFGKITSLVNNAGIGVTGLLENMTVESLDTCYRTNQLGTLLGLKHVVGPMRANGMGSIVNIGSVAALKGHAGTAAYAGTKAAQVGITIAAATELAPYNIRVNVVHPGFVLTEMLKEAMGPDGGEVAAAMTPMKRAALPEEIVGTVVYLLSDESSYTTGVQFAVDGGYASASLAVPANA
ncbi:MAG: SDR family oxidoreductase [Cupriavidus sp.]|nr:SDR family oxidoreductase [Cupriavidus sp.]